MAHISILNAVIHIKLVWSDNPTDDIKRIHDDQWSILNLYVPFTSSGMEISVSKFTRCLIDKSVLNDHLIVWQAYY